MLETIYSKQPINSNIWNYLTMCKQMIDIE